MNNYRRQFLKKISFLLGPLLYGCSENPSSQLSNLVDDDSVTSVTPTTPAYPFVHIPFNDESGLSVLNMGSFDSNFTISTINESHMWQKPGWITTDIAQPVAVYTDDARVSSVFNVLKNADRGIGGQAMLMSFWAECKDTRGTFITFGSTNISSSGWQVMQSGNNLKMHINQNGNNISPKLMRTGGFPVDGEHHIAILIDFKNADYLTWIDGVQMYSPIIDREQLLLLANNPIIDNSIGITLFSRNNAVNPGDRTQEYPWTGSIKDFLAVNLTDSENPWSHIEYVVKELSNVRAGSLASCLGVL